MTHVYQRKSALTAGIALIIMALAAAFSYGMVLGNVVVDGNPERTLANIQSSYSFFNTSIMGWLMILICDIVVAWSLYMFLKPFHAELSLLAAWLRLIYTCLLGIAILNLVFVLILSSNTEFLSMLDDNQIQALVMLFLTGFDSIWSIGLIIFGGHLLMVGYITYRSQIVPKVISILLFIASTGYIIIHFSYTFLPKLDTITSTVESILSVPMALGELGFGIWLLTKGGKVPKGR